MRILSAAIFILFLLSIAQAASPVSLAGRVALIIAGNQSFTYLNFTPDNSSVYYIVRANGEEKFLVWVHPALPAQDLLLVGEPILDEERAGQLLPQIYSANGADLSTLSKFNQTHALMRDFASSRTPGEHKCDIYLGLDEHECTDFLSCQKACYSRTSFCMPLALGIGRPLINAIYDYSDFKRNLTVLLETEDAAYALFEANPNTENFDEYSHAVYSIDSLEAHLNSNPLFSDYQICFPLNHNLTALSAAKRNLATMRTKAYPILASRQRAADFTEYAKSGWNNSLPIMIPVILQGQEAVEAPEAADGTANGSQPASSADENAPGATTPSNDIPLYVIAAFLAIAGVILGIAVFLVYTRVFGRHARGIDGSAQKKAAAKKVQ